MQSLKQNPLNMNGFKAQFVEHCSGNVKTIGMIPVEA